jgi:hypothetical protein
MKNTIVASLQLKQKANNANEPNSDELKPSSTELNSAPTLAQSSHASLFSNL